MEGPLRLRLEVLGIWGVSAAQPLYVKFLWRGEKQKTPPLRPFPHPLQQQQQQQQAEFLLPFDEATDGSRLLLRVWRCGLLKKKEITQKEICIPTSEHQVFLCLYTSLLLICFLIIFHFFSYLGCLYAYTLYIYIICMHIYILFIHAYMYACKLSIYVYISIYIYIYIYINAYIYIIYREGEREF